MKIFRILTMSLLLVAGTAFALSAQRTCPLTKDKYETAVYNVALHCENCKAKVLKNLPFEKGVKDVTVDLSAKTVTVKFDPRKNTAEGIRKAIEKLGYAATLRTGEPEKK